MGILGFLQESHKSMVSRVIDWTPQMAEHAFMTLNTHEKQRAFKPAVADRYRRIMEEGKWRQPWPQCCIAFSSDGVLLNGQHTLWAVWKSGLTIRINTAWNLTSEDYLLFDDFQSRNLAQLSKQAGLTNTSVRNGLAKVVMALDEKMGQAVQPQVSDVIRITSDDLLMNSVITYIIGKKSAMTVRYSEVALCYALFKIAKVHGLDVSMDFFNRVVSGVNLNADDPRLHLARFLLNRAVKSWHDRLQVIMGIIKAFNAWISGASMQALYVRGNEHMPEVLGLPLAPLVRQRPRVAAK